MYVLPNKERGDIYQTHQSSESNLSWEENPHFGPSYFLRGFPFRDVIWRLIWSNAFATYNQSIVKLFIKRTKDLGRGPTSFTFLSTVYHTSIFVPKNFTPLLADDCSSHKAAFVRKKAPCVEKQRIPNLSLFFAFLGLWNVICSYAYCHCCFYLLPKNEEHSMGEIRGKRRKKMYSFHVILYMMHFIWESSSSLLYFFLKKSFIVRRKSSAGCYRFM